MRAIQQLILGVMIVAIVAAHQDAAVAQTEPSAFSGITIDDSQAELTGEWMSSSKVRPYLGTAYLHDGAAGKGEKSAKFTFRVPIAGDYHLLIAYTAGSNRSPKVPVTVETADGKITAYLNQRQVPELGTGFQSIGEFPFSDTADGTVLIETAETAQHVIVDGIRLLTPNEYKTALSKEKQNRKPATVAKTAEEKKPPEPKPQPPEFVRQPIAETFTQLTPQQFDALLTESGAENDRKLIDDVGFLRRVSLDLVGRQPSLEEYRAFLSDPSSDRRGAAVERLLASENFGQNWANYWTDVIAARHEEPQLTFLNYKPFRAWLAGEFNTGTGWDEIVFRMLTAIGTVGDGPEGTFVGFHQGERNKLAGESARVFLGLKIGCAQCHDHPFIDMPQETFHGMAAFFARTKVKLPWNDSNGIEISSADKGEHKMPGAKDEMVPTIYKGDALELGLDDLQRREKLAHWIVRGDNPYFARAFVNHIQARLLGRGFFAPVDDLGEGVAPLNPEAHHALAGHFIASGFELKSLIRLLVSTHSYQREQPPQSIADDSFSGATPKKLRGDEVFDSLAVAIDLPNSEFEVEAATDETRFPPPPKSMRDVVAEVFGFDPALDDDLVTRTMTQAIFMMNNTQLHRQVDAAPDSETVLSKLLAKEPDDGVVVDVLFARVLARRPTAAERALVLKHVASIEDRGAAFEDVLWSLLNSAEFTTRN